MMLLDTNVVSAARKPRDYPEVVAWIEDQRSGTLRLPGPVLAELEFGVRRVGTPRDQARLRMWLGEIVETYEITEMSAVAFAAFGDMLSRPALAYLWMNVAGSKRPRRAADLQIAAIAITRDETLATLNSRDFDRIRAEFPSLRTVDPRTVQYSS